MCMDVYMYVYMYDMCMYIYVYVCTYVFKYHQQLLLFIRFGKPVRFQWDNILECSRTI